MKTERIIANFNAIIERECQKEVDFKRLTDLQAVLIGELKQRVHELEVDNTKLKTKVKKGLKACELALEYDLKSLEPNKELCLVLTKVLKK